MSELHRIWLMLRIRITISEIKGNVNEIGREMQLGFLGGLRGCREISGFHPKMDAPPGSKTCAARRQRSTNLCFVAVRCMVSLGFCHGGLLMNVE